MQIATLNFYRYPNSCRPEIFDNPYSGRVLGRLVEANRFMQINRAIHRSLHSGGPYEPTIGLAGCWTLLIIASDISSVAGKRAIVGKVNPFKARTKGSIPSETYFRSPRDLACC